LKLTPGFRVVKAETEIVCLQSIPPHSYSTVVLKIVCFKMQIAPHHHSAGTDLNYLKGTGITRWTRASFFHLHPECRARTFHFTGYLPTKINIISQIVYFHVHVLLAILDLSTLIRVKMVETLMAHHLATMAGLAGRYTVCLPRSSG
jgi:hypothetical protein